MMTRLDLDRRLAALDFGVEYGDLEPARARQLKHAARLAYKLEAAQRKQARKQVEMALHQGKLAKPDRCEACHDHTVGLAAHHEDHADVLRVTWLCVRPAGGCHAQADRG